MRRWEKLFRFRAVEIETLSAPKREAFLSLLDDTSPAVRRALLAHFQHLGPSAAPFLEAISRGSNRVLARHASWFLDELKFSDPVAEFRGFIRAMNYELESGSLLLSRTVSPNVDAGDCCMQLDAIAARCRELIVEPSSAREKCRVLNRVLFHEGGFHGNVEHYTDPRNSFIDQVLARRTGIPISLSVIYLLVAERVGLSRCRWGLRPPAWPARRCRARSPGRWWWCSRRRTARSSRRARWWTGSGSPS